MTNFIPIFPLSIVIYPGETVNLHVFEPRYKQLITECAEQKKPFGSPVLIGDELKEYGTLMEVRGVEKVYDNGEMDIRVRGRRVFRILEVVHEVPEKLYAGAIVHYPRNLSQPKPVVMILVLMAIRELHRLMEVSREFKKLDDALLSYDVAHESGLSQEEEYEMLCLLHEGQRLEYLKQHLGKILPVMVEIDRLKKRYKLNGHFQDPGIAKF
ncbi:MAG TPA: LON peptidase substrate-binding domain-containing protein [Chitinophagaceae bacterium]|jgi:Lon protease-like protein|nr:LON peptidase substrate-binding domain-containing protein [Chitinophagaceae bacterium]